jgi:hypothetical protein
LSFRRVSTLKRCSRVSCRWAGQRVRMEPAGSQAGEEGVEVYQASAESGLERRGDPGVRRGHSWCLKLLEKAWSGGEESGSRFLDLVVFPLFFHFRFSEVRWLSLSFSCCLPTRHCVYKDRQLALWRRQRIKHHLLSQPRRLTEIPVINAAGRVTTPLVVGAAGSVVV